jgi:Ser/Thr protein kinase RdoA (MazF antagonist)
MSNPSNNNGHPYQALTPDTILDAIEASGFECNGRLLALNSYENRVYQVGLEDDGFVIAKFYRPGRWSDAAIEEEHAFALELAAHEVPVVAPLEDSRGATLLHHAGFRFALFPRKGGHWPELEQPDTLLRLGRFLGRLHAVGASRPFEHRPALTIDSFGVQSRNFLLEHDFLPHEYIEQYSDLTKSLLEKVANGFERAGNYTPIRLHGDFHPGNILWTEGGAHLVDLDDCRMGPAIQDLWMLLSGERGQMNAQLSELVAGYEEFFDFKPRQLHLIEPLRSLRLIHYAAWLARRWDDPAFPLAFPWFNTPRYWEEQILTLREQLNRLDAPVLKY